VTRSVLNWMRQVQFMIADEYVKFDSPIQQPTFDKITYEQEAMVALVGSFEISESIAGFNKRINAYIATRGTAAQMDGMVSQYEPQSKDVAAGWHREVDKHGQAVLDLGKTIIGQMRVELQADRVHEGQADAL